MGYFAGTTASNGARIKEGKEEEVKKLLDKYDFSCGLNCQIEHGSIEIWGEEWPNLWLKPKNDEENADCTDNFEEFLEELSPFLAEDLVIHAVGAEKCIFPLSAMEIKVTPQGVVRGGGFKWMC